VFGGIVVKKHIQFTNVMIVDWMLNAKQKTQDVEVNMSENKPLIESNIAIQVSLAELLDMATSSLSTIKSNISYHSSTEEDKKALVVLIKNYGYKSRILYRKLLEQYSTSNLDLVKTIGNEEDNEAPF
jgi:hypothetical protein